MEQRRNNGFAVFQKACQENLTADKTEATQHYRLKPLENVMPITIFNGQRQSVCQKFHTFRRSNKTGL
jgi:hypothetical protein